MPVLEVSRTNLCDWDEVKNPDVVFHPYYGQVMYPHSY